MDKECFLATLSRSSIKEINRIIEENGKEPKLSIPITIINYKPHNK